MVKDSQIDLKDVRKTKAKGNLTFANDEADGGERNNKNSPATVINRKMINNQKLAGNSIRQVFILKL